MFSPLFDLSYPLHGLESGGNQVAIVTYRDIPPLFEVDCCILIVLIERKLNPHGNVFLDLRLSSLYQQLFGTPLSISLYGDSASF